MVLYYALPYVIGGVLVAVGVIGFLAWFVIDDWTLLFLSAAFGGVGLFIFWWLGVFGG